MSVVPPDHRNEAVPPLSFSHLPVTKSTQPLFSTLPEYES